MDENLNGYLGKQVKVKMDRPMGSTHPRCGFIYPVNYGFIPGTMAGDGHEIDAYVLGVFEPIEEYEGIVIGIIKRHDDVEDKLVVASKINDYDKYQIAALVEFQERFFDTEVITMDFLRQSIRNTVRCIIRNGDQVLLLQESYKGEAYCFLPGGGIEFREAIGDAVKREIMEELNVNVTEFAFKTCIENHFEIEGMKSHEIVHLYEVEVDDSSHLTDGRDLHGDLFPSTLRWLSAEEIKEKDIILYPEKLDQYLWG